MPSCGNPASRLSKEHSEPDGCFSPFSDVNHSASRTFTTNQPSAAGARPEPESSSRASGTARLYSVDGSRDPSAADARGGVSRLAHSAETCGAVYRCQTK